MGRRVFLAGATGVVGRRLIPLLLGAGHATAGTTRSADKAADLESRGVEPVVVDALDGDALRRAVARWKPDVVIHQLTDLPAGLAPDAMGEGIRRNARLRAEGTRNLVRAAAEAGAERVIAQSIAWAYAPGALPHDEDHPLDLDADGDRAISVGGVAALEAAVLGAAPLAGVVLRLGRLYGPGTGRERAERPTPLHVDAAAHAALLAMACGVSGVFNIVEADPEVSNARAVGELGWRAEFRLSAPTRHPGRPEGRRDAAG